MKLAGHTATRSTGNVPVDHSDWHRAVEKNRIESAICSRFDAFDRTMRFTVGIILHRLHRIRQARYDWPHPPMSPPLCHHPLPAHRRPPHLFLPFRSLPTAAKAIPCITMPRRFRTSLKQAGKKTGKCLQNAAWQTCKCILWTACAPCLCCAVVLLPRRRHASGPFAPQKPPMPMPRRRPLSIPSSHFQHDQRLLEQPHSMFMTKLPLEIRRCIYEYALGGRSIHARVSEDQLYARRCATRGVCRCGHKRLKEEENLDFALALLTTCRLM